MHLEFEVKNNGKAELFFLRFDLIFDVESILLIKIASLSIINPPDL